MLALFFFMGHAVFTRLLTLDQVVDRIEPALGREPARALFRDLARGGLGRARLLPERDAELLHESAAQSQRGHRGAAPLLGMQVFGVFVQIPLKVVQSLMTFVEPPHGLGEALGLTPLHRPRKLPDRLETFQTP